MCGILSVRNVDSELFDKLYGKFDTNYRRGYVDNRYGNDRHGVVCCFQRLPLVSIKNKSANAPYVKDGVVVMLNGELYNYRKEFAPSEVEWIHSLYTKDKRTLFYLSLLKGEFAYVIIDLTSQKLICYRSFPGVVLLYGYFNGDRGQWIVSSEKLYKKQKQIEPGTYYIFQYFLSQNNGRLKKVKKDFDLILNIISPPDVSKFNELFGEVVRDYILHKDDTRKVTISYSGGVDSSFVLLHALSQPILRKEITQIIACQYSGTKEYEIVKRNLEYVKSRFGIEYLIIDMHKYPPTQISNEIIKRLPSAKNNIIKLRSALRNYLVAKFSTNHIIIGGEGADELFGGYPFFKNTDIYTFKRKQVQSLYSMKAINLDRTNNIPFIFTKEWRVPFLDYRVVDFCLQYRFEYGKGYLKQALQDIKNRSGIEIDVFMDKYGNEERLSEKYLGIYSHDLENQ